MKSEFFNSLYEISMRLVLLLNTYNLPLGLEELFTYDFIATYGKEFGLTDISLNGDSEFTMSKATLRRKKVKEGIEYLVRNGYAEPLLSEKGIKYKLINRGINFAKKISNGYYADEYILMVNSIKKDSSFKTKSATEIILNKIKESNHE